MTALMDKLRKYRFIRWKITPQDSYTPVRFSYTVQHFGRMEYKRRHPMVEARGRYSRRLVDMTRRYIHGRRYLFPYRLHRHFLVFPLRRRDRRSTEGHVKDEDKQAMTDRHTQQTPPSSCARQTQITRWNSDSTYLRLDEAASSPRV